MSEERVILLVSTAIADVIVGGGWAVTAAAVAVWLRAIRERRLAELPAGVAEDPSGALVWVFAGVSFVFWPAGLALGLWFLSKPPSARTGYWCLMALLGYVSVSVVVAIGIVTVGAALLPTSLLLP